MSKETVRKAIVDGDGGNKLVTVVPTIADPTKFGLVICNADGSPISGGGGSSITLKTDGVANGSQTILDLKAGANINLTDDGVGGITIDASGGGGGGTVDSIVPGANIDVDNTDPANPIVSVENLVLTDITDVTATVTELNYIDGVTSAIQTQLNAKEGTITATTSADYYRGDKTFQTLNKTAVGLGNVDNTSDANKPISTATQTALDLKVDENGAITGATKTKITYDAKGLVTSGADATTADIADSANKRYVTDANLTVIGNTSGTNTGDNAVNTLYSGLVSNATHTGEMIGSGVLTADPTLVSNKALKSSLAGTEEVLINDAGTLKKTTAQDIANLGGGGGGGSQPYTALSADTTITQGNVYGVTASTVDINLTLSDGTSSGQTLTVSKRDETDYSVYVNNATLDGGTIQLTIFEESIDLYRTGTTFIIK